MESLEATYKIKNQKGNIPWKDKIYIRRTKYTLEEQKKSGERKEKKNKMQKNIK